MKIQPITEWGKCNKQRNAIEICRAAFIKPAQAWFQPSEPVVMSHCGLHTKLISCRHEATKRVGVVNRFSKKRN